MKFIVFAGDSYYANGGAGDRVLVTDNVYEAIAIAIASIDVLGDWAHVYDIENDKIISDGETEGDYCGIDRQRKEEIDELVAQVRRKREI